MARGPLASDQLGAHLDSSHQRICVPGHSRPHNLAQAQLTHVTGGDNCMMWLENSGHIVTEDYEGELVYAATESFIEEHI